MRARVRYENRRIKSARRRKHASAFGYGGTGTGSTVDGRGRMSPARGKTLRGRVIAATFGYTRFILTRGDYLTVRNARARDTARASYGLAGNQYTAHVCATPPPPPPPPPPPTTPTPDPPLAAVLSRCNGVTRYDNNNNNNNYYNALRCPKPVNADRPASADHGRETIPMLLSRILATRM